MRVGIDATPLLGTRTGVGTYVGVAMYVGVWTYVGVGAWSASVSPTSCSLVAVTISGASNGVSATTGNANSLASFVVRGSNALANASTG